MLEPGHIEERRAKVEPTKHWRIPRCQLWKGSGRKSIAGSAGFFVRPRVIIGLSTSQAKDAAADPMVWIHAAVSLVSLQGTPSAPAKQKCLSLRLFGCSPGNALSAVLLLSATANHPWWPSSKVGGKPFHRATPPQCHRVSHAENLGRCASRRPLARQDHWHVR